MNLPIKQNPQRLLQCSSPLNTSQSTLKKIKQHKDRKQSANFNLGSRSRTNLNELTIKLEGMQQRLHSREVHSPSTTRVRGRAETITIMHRPQSDPTEKISQNSPLPANQNEIVRFPDAPPQQTPKNITNKMSFSAFISKAKEESISKQNKQRSSHSFGFQVPKPIIVPRKKNKQESGNQLAALKAKMKQINEGYTNRVKTQCSISREEEGNQDYKYKESINKSIYILQMMKNKETKINQTPRTKRSMSLQVSVLRGFSFGHVLGKGKFGQVFLAKHIETGFLVAIKKIPKAKLKQHNLIDQFTKEIKLHNCLDHPKLVKFYGFFEQRQDIYLVLQYLNGGTLFEYMNSVGTLNIKEAVEILKDVIQGLSYMHQRSICHRDIKPQNIVISSGVAKLCDFGWASVIYAPRSTYCGTLDYASPQILEHKKYDLSVDLWSLGVLTYQMLIGAAPFQDKDRSAIRQKILSVDKTHLAYSDQVSPQASDFIELLMQKNPTMRPRIDKLLSHQLFSMHGLKAAKKII